MLKHVDQMPVVQGLRNVALMGVVAFARTLHLVIVINSKGYGGINSFLEHKILRLPENILIIFSFQMLLKSSQDAVPQEQIVRYVGVVKHKTIQTDHHLKYNEDVP